MPSVRPRKKNRPTETSRRLALVTHSPSRGIAPLWAWVTSFRVEIAFLTVLGVAAYGQQIFHLTLQMDDWIRVRRTDSVLALQTGRWMFALVWECFARNAIAPSFSGMVCVAVSSACFLRFGQFLGLRDRLPLLLTASLMLTHPMYEAQFRFYSHQLPLAVGFALVVAALEVLEPVLWWREWRLPTRVGWLRFLAIAGLLACAIAVRQSLLLFTCGLLIGRGLLSSSPKPHRFEGNREMSHPAAFLWLGVSLTASVVLYLGLWKAALWGTGTQVFLEGPYAPSEALVGSFADLTLNGKRALWGIWHHRFLTHGHLPPVVELFLSLVLLGNFGVGLWVLFQPKEPQRKADARRWIGGVFWPALLMTVPWWISLVVTSDVAVRPTALLGLVPLVPIFLARFLAPAFPETLRVVIGGGAALVVLFSAHQISHRSQELILNNVRQLGVLRTMVDRVEAHPQAARYLEAKPRRLFVVGGLRTWRSALFYRRFSAFERSRKIQEALFLLKPLERGSAPHRVTVVAAGEPWWCRRIRQEVRSSASPEERQGLQQRLSQSPLWPASGSVHLIGKAAYVVLGRDAEALDCL